MSATAVSIPLRVQAVQFWERFRSLAGRRVEEGNILCGERLWVVAAQPGAAQPLTIRSTSDPTDLVECSLDLESGVVTCIPGAAIRAGALQFETLGATTACLRSDGALYSVEQALDMVLDELVWMEDCGCRATQEPGEK